MRFGHIELGVSDPMAAMAYYTGSLGFELVDNQNDTFIWLKKDDVEFLLRPQGDYELPCIVFYSEDPESHGVPVERKGNCFHFEDADGNSFQIVDPNVAHSD
ncbi:MAG: VOC family protein [Planctomycetota bacterium]|jgi:catechol 2,3-dioxygenase-like lactoylglutathione lyase family enzyme